MDYLQIKILREENGHLLAFQPIQVVPASRGRAVVIDEQGAQEAIIARPVTLWMELVGTGGRTHEEAEMEMLTVLDDNNGMVELKRAHVDELVRLGWAKQCDEDPPHYHMQRGHTLDDVAKKFNLTVTMEAILHRFRTIYGDHVEALRKGQVPPEMADLGRQFEDKQTTTTPDQDVMAAMGITAIAPSNPLEVIKAFPAIVGLATMAMLEVARLKRRVTELEARR